jgi:hypothetical protein
MIRLFLISNGVAFKHEEWLKASPQGIKVRVGSWGCTP